MVGQLIRRFVAAAFTGFFCPQLPLKTDAAVDLGQGGDRKVPKGLRA